MAKANFSGQFHELHAMGFEVGDSVQELLVTTDLDREGQEA